MRKIQTIKKVFKNGFTTQIVLRPGFKEHFFAIGVNFGSADPQIPGTAHFLEHQLFNKDTGNIGKEFTKIQAFNNAYTTFDRTVFYARGNKNTKRIIDLLFQVVSQPYFSLNSIEKERAIIQEEAAMYLNQPLVNLNNALMSELFNNNLGIDIVGNKKDIASISADSLKESYQNFYTSGNMEFIAVGDFSDYAIKQIEHLTKEYSKMLSPKKYSKNKPKIEVGKLSNSKLSLDLATSGFSLGLLLPDFKKMLYQGEIAEFLLNIMIESKIGELSSYMQEAINNGDLNNPLSVEITTTGYGNFAIISGFSANYQKVVSDITKLLKKPIKSLNQAKAQFDLLLKSGLGNEIRSYDSLEALANQFLAFSLKGEDYLDFVRQAGQVKFNDYANFVDEVIDKSKMCYIIADNDARMI